MDGGERPQGGRQGGWEAWADGPQHVVLLLEEEVGAPARVEGPLPPPPAVPGQRPGGHPWDETVATVPCHPPGHHRRVSRVRKSKHDWAIPIAVLHTII